MGQCIEEEYERSCESVLTVTGRDRLLDDIPWLRESVDRRSPSVNALNLMQIQPARGKSARRTSPLPNPTARSGRT